MKNEYITCLCTLINEKKYIFYDVNVMEWIAVLLIIFEELIERLIKKLTKRWERMDAWNEDMENKWMLE